MHALCVSERHCFCLLAVCMIISLNSNGVVPRADREDTTLYNPAILSSQTVTQHPVVLLLLWLVEVMGQLLCFVFLMSTALHTLHTIDQMKFIGSVLCMAVKLHTCTCVPHNLHPSVCLCVQVYVIVALYLIFTLLLSRLASPGGW